MVLPMSAQPNALRQQAILVQVNVLRSVHARAEPALILRQQLVEPVLDSAVGVMARLILPTARPAVMDMPVGAFGIASASEGGHRRIQA